MRGVLFVFLFSCQGLASCSPGVIDTTSFGSRDADTRDGDEGDTSQDDPCAFVSCPEGQACEDGVCRSLNVCSGITCANPGEVCDPRTGACVAGGADEDDDSFTIAAGDCDDGDPEIHPGVAEVCDGVDQDCNGEIDDGIPPRECTTACGTGTSTCEGGTWVCSVPETCECTPPGRTEEAGCGRCGTKRRTCRDDYTWSDWSGCSGEGVCSPGERQAQDCGDCGRQERECADDCTWGAWGSCRGVGSCSNGYHCTSDGQCVCPGPHYGLRDGQCLPSCGARLGEAGYANDGLGCCTSGCVGRETAPAYDCIHCCESPPGCW